MANATDSHQPAGAREPDRREIARVVRHAALSCYGVTAVGSRSWVRRVTRRLTGRPRGGVTVRTSPELMIAVTLDLAPSVPREQVLANVRDAISYAVQRDIRRSIARLDLTVVES